MNYMRTLAERKRALAASRAARGDLRSAVGEVIGIYQTHPVPALAGAAGVGFVKAPLRNSRRLVRVGMRIAGGPAWHLIRQYLIV